MSSSLVIQKFLNDLIIFINQFYTRNVEDLLLFVTPLQKCIQEMKIENFSLNELEILLTASVIDDTTPKEIQAIFLYLCIAYAVYNRTSNLGMFLDRLSTTRSTEIAAPPQIRHLLHYSILAYDASKKAFTFNNLLDGLYQKLIYKKIQPSKVLEILQFYDITKIIMSDSESLIPAVIKVYEQLLVQDISPDTLPLSFISKLGFLQRDSEKLLIHFVKRLLKAGLSPTLLLNTTTKSLIETQIANAQLIEIYNFCFDHLPRNQEGLVQEEDAIPSNLPAYLCYKGEFEKAAEGYTYPPALEHCIQYKKTHLIYKPPKYRQPSYCFSILRAWERYNLSPQLTLASLYNREFVPSRLFKEDFLEEKPIIKKYMTSSSITDNYLYDEQFDAAFTASEICLTEHLPFIAELFYYNNSKAYSWSLTEEKEQNHYQAANSFFLFDNHPLAYKFGVDDNLDYRIPGALALCDLIIKDRRTKKEIDVYLINRLHMHKMRDSLNFLYELTDWLLSSSFTNSNRINLKDWYHTSIGKLLLKNILERLLSCKKAHIRRIYGQILLMLAAYNPTQSFTIFRLEMISTLVSHYCPRSKHTDEVLNEFIQQHRHDKPPTALLFINDKTRCTIHFRQNILTYLSIRKLIVLRLVNLMMRQLVDEELLNRIQEKLLLPAQIEQIFGLACESGNVFLREACIYFFNTPNDVGSWLVRAYLYDTFTGKMTPKLFIRWQSLFIYDESNLHELFFAANLTWNASLIYRLYFCSKVPMVLARSFDHYDFVRYKQRLLENVYTQTNQYKKINNYEYASSLRRENPEDFTEFTSHLSQFSFFTAKLPIKDYVPSWYVDLYDDFFTRLETVQKKLRVFISNFLLIVAKCNDSECDKKASRSTFFPTSNRSLRLHDQLKKILKTIENALDINIFYLQIQIEDTANLIDKYIAELKNPIEKNQLQQFLKLKDSEAAFTFEDLRELLGAPSTLYTEHLKHKRDELPLRSQGIGCHPEQTK